MEIKVRLFPRVVFSQKILHSLLLLADKTHMLDFFNSDNPTTRILALSGHVDALHTLRLEKIVEEAKQGACHHVILNCSEVGSMDLGGLGNLFTWYHTLHTNQIVLSIMAPSPMVRHMLESLRLTELIPIYLSIPEAISHHPAPKSVSP